jgi:hypothetical protein
MTSAATPPPSGDELDFEIELEPTLTAAEATADYSRPTDHSAHVALIAGGPVSIGSEATALLHDRIQSAALAFVVLYAILFPLNLFFRSEMRWTDAPADDGAILRESRIHRPARPGQHGRL